MTCEDDDEKNGAGMVEKAARQIVPLLASRPARTLARLLPQGVKRSIVTVLLTVTDALRR